MRLGHRRKVERRKRRRTQQQIKKNIFTTTRQQHICGMQTYIFGDILVVAIWSKRISLLRINDADDGTIHVDGGAERGISERMCALAITRCDHRNASSQLTLGAGPSMQRTWSGRWKSILEILLPRLDFFDFFFLVSTNRQCWRIPFQRAPRCPTFNIGQFMAKYIQPALLISAIKE